MTAPDFPDKPLSPDEIAAALREGGVCRECKGRGWHTVAAHLIKRNGSPLARCDACKGTGYVDK